MFTNHTPIDVLNLELTSTDGGLLPDHICTKSVNQMQYVTGMKHMKMDAVVAGPQLICSRSNQSVT